MNNNQKTSTWNGKDINALLGPDSYIEMTEDRCGLVREFPYDVPKGAGGRRVHCYGEWYKRNNKWGWCSIDLDLSMDVISIAAIAPDRAYEYRRRFNPKDALSQIWMQTWTGKQFHFFDPAEREIDICDIARSLAMQPHFNGHLNRHFSIAEHSVLVAQYLFHTYPDVFSFKEALYALLHDAAEAYIGDMVLPLKRTMPDFQAVERIIQRAIIDKFIGRDPTQFKPEVVQLLKEVDERILNDERHALIPPSSLVWNTSPQPLDVQIRGWDWEKAEQIFLQQFYFYTRSTPELKSGDNFPEIKL